MQDKLTVVPRQDHNFINEYHSGLTQYISITVQNIWIAKTQNTYIYICKYQLLFETRKSKYWSTFK